MEKHAIILANGVIEDIPLIRERLADVHQELVVAADGGARHAEDLGLKPDFIVGDLDSLTTSHIELAASAEFERHRPHKDETDLELALLTAISRGAERLIVIGATGGRFDMTIGNTVLLAHPEIQGREIEIWHGQQTIWLIRPPGDKIQGQEGDTLSLIPLNGDASGITLTGLAYPLHEETLQFGEVRGMSNVLNSQIGHVAIRNGALLAVHTPREVN